MKDEQIIEELKQIAYNKRIERVSVQVIPLPIIKHSFPSFCGMFTGHVMYNRNMSCATYPCRGLVGTHIEVITTIPLYAKYVLAHEVGHAVKHIKRSRPEGVLNDECAATEWAIAYLKPKIDNIKDYQIGLAALIHALDDYFTVYANTRKLKNIRNKYILK
jgi:hypothetical protein